MKKDKIKVGDWVRVLKVGIDGVYEVESIDGDNYPIIQKEGKWTNRLTLKINEITKLTLSKIVSFDVSEDEVKTAIEKSERSIN